MEELDTLLGQARERRSRQKHFRTYCLICLLVVAAMYAVTIYFKGWHERYLIGLIGAGFLVFQAAVHHRLVRAWDFVIGDRS